MNERKNNLDRWTMAMQKTAIPMRLINGAHDPISGRQIADKYNEIIPNPDVVILDEIGHYPNYEAPELVVKYFLEFVEKLEIA